MFTGSKTFSYFHCILLIKPCQINQITIHEHSLPKISKLFNISKICLLKLLTENDRIQGGHNRIRDQNYYQAINRISNDPLSFLHPFFIPKSSQIIDAADDQKENRYAGGYA